MHTQNIQQKHKTLLMRACRPRACVEQKGGRKGPPPLSSLSFCLRWGTGDFENTGRERWRLTIQMSTKQPFGLVGLLFGRPRS